jgi:hypothetical protein
MVITKKIFQMKWLRNIINFPLRINKRINPLFFRPGDKVTLINDPKQLVYIIEHMLVDKAGLPKISLGSMRQLPPSIAYRVRSETYGGINDFRADSLQLKSQTAVERKISSINQLIKEAEERFYDHKYLMQEEEVMINRLKRELSEWQKQPEHTI